MSNTEETLEVEVINDNTSVTANSKQLEVLKQNFPQCFDKDGNFIQDRFEEIIAGTGIGFSKESYGMNWLGKSYARLLASEEPRTLLKANKEHNSKPENADSENLLIKGDNLEVLKHLVNAYKGEIKMIYIDPPYNTGGDGFVYQDDRKFTPEQLSKLAGVDIEEAKRILAFTQSKANSHSAWLTFMYPRLYIAQRLLKSDGVIFISIDDNEVAQLKLLCNEIFGEQNFIAQIIVDGTPKNDPYIVSTSHEYVLVYASNFAEAKKVNYGYSDPLYDELVSIFESNGENYEKTIKDLQDFYNKNDLKNKNISNYKFADEDGIYRIGPIDDPQSSGPKDDRINLKTGRICKTPNRGWSCTIDTWNDWIIDNLIEFPDSDEVSPSKKTYINRDRLDVMRSYFKMQTRRDSLYLKRIFNTSFPPFANPKPIELLKTFLQHMNDKDGIYLDFFAGSGTLGDAIYQTNFDDKNGNRKFILVQLPEIIELKGTNKAKKIASSAISFIQKNGNEPATIFEITKHRLLLSAQIIKEKDPVYSADLGFKIFETIPVFEGYQDDIQKLDEQTKLFDGASLDDEQLQSLLLTWQVYDRIPLTCTLEEINFNGYTAYRHQETCYLMNKGFDTSALAEFLRQLDETDLVIKKVVVFGYNFDSKALREINDAIRSYKNKKQLSDLNVVVRY